MPESIQSSVAVTAPINVEQVILAGWAQGDMALLPVPDTSMQPTFGPGDLLLVDRSVKDFGSDDIYAFSAGGQVYVRRLQRWPGLWLKMICDNPTYRAYDFSRDEWEHVEVFGRVVRIWNQRRPVCN